MNGIESQYKETIDVIRLNLLGRIGKETAAMFGVRVVPTTLILDGSGMVVARQVGIPEQNWIEDYFQRMQ